MHSILLQDVAIDAQLTFLAVSISLLNLKPFKALFCPKGIEFHAIFLEKIVLNNIIRNRDKFK